MSDNWRLVYDNFIPDQEGLREALCSLGNGYFCTRGAAAESEADEVHYPGTYLAGGYNRLVTEIAGREVENEDLVNMPNWLRLRFAIEDHVWFDLRAVDILSYRQELDLKHGVLSRDIRFRDHGGRETRLQDRRLVSMDNQHLAAHEMRLTAENWSGRVRIASRLDGQVVNDGVARYRALNGKHLCPLFAEEIDHESVLLGMMTTQSHMRISQALRTRVELQRGARIERLLVKEDEVIGHDFELELTQGETLRVEKVLAICTTRDRAVSSPRAEACKAIARAADFASILARHKLAWKHLWMRCDIGMEGANNSGLILRLHIFHLLQTASYHSIDMDTGVPARGWTGEAYRGHIFWDELFIFPFLNLRIPEITRALLRYRYRRLDEARWNARESGYRGAMYPWQSGSDGREESQILHLNPRSGRWNPDNSRLQRHINIAIAYNVWQYHQVTSDSEFMYFYGAEMLAEIARFWASIAEWNPERERYEIRRVMGPDEYHDAYPNSDEPGLNNNAYTNIMASWVLCRALEVIESLPEDRRAELCDDLEISEAETAEWRKISARLFVPFHDRHIISQFEGYEHLDEFDWEGYRQKYDNIQRLDRILGAEGDTPNHYKASKQADVLMLFYLFSAEELSDIFDHLGYEFDPQWIPENVDYYLARTSHGSTLSGVTHSWVLARSDRKRSWELFERSLHADIEDIQGGTTPEGIHLGAMAGTVDMIQRGYTGLEPRCGKLVINPSLPEHLERLTFAIRYRQHWLSFEITQHTIWVHSRRVKADPITLVIVDKEYELPPGEKREFSL